MLAGWITYDNRKISMFEISHQHLSNIYYYTHYTMAEYYPESIREYVVEWLRARFKGIILPYKPVADFDAERQRLLQLNALQPNGEIIMNGEKLGSY